MQCIHYTKISKHTNLYGAVDMRLGKQNTGALFGKLVLPAPCSGHGYTISLGGLVCVAHINNIYINISCATDEAVLK